MVDTIDAAITPFIMEYDPCDLSGSSRGIGPSEEGDDDYDREEYQIFLLSLKA